MCAEHPCSTIHLTRYGHRKTSQTHASHSQKDVFMLRQNVEAVLRVPIVASSGERSSVSAFVQSFNGRGISFRLERREIGNSCFTSERLWRSSALRLGGLSPGGGRKGKARPSGCSKPAATVCSPTLTGPRQTKESSDPEQGDFTVSWMNLQAWPRVQKPVFENSKQGLGLGRNSDEPWAKVQSAPILHSLVRQNLHMRVYCTAFFCSALVIATLVDPGQTFLQEISSL